MEWNVIRDLFLITGMVSLFFLIIVVNKKRKGFIKVLLLLILSQAFFFFLLFYSIYHKYYTFAGISFLFGNGTGTFLAPIVYFFCIAVVSNNKKFVKKFWLHLIPYFIKVLVYNLPTSIAFIFGIKPWFADLSFYLPRYANISENFYFLVYAVLALILLKRIEKATKFEYSNLKHRDLSWLRYFIIGNSFLVIIDTVFSFYKIFNEDATVNYLTELVVFGYVLHYLLLAYKGVFQSNILLPEFLLNNISLSNITTNIEVKSSEQNNNLTTNANNEIVFSEIEIYNINKALNKQLKEKKIFLNETLRLKDLAKEMDISEKKLSQFINQELNLNFYTLVNQCRVEEVKNKIASGNFEHLSILGIAMNSGFQSKSSFNRIFKHHTGKSPSEFRKTL